MHALTISASMTHGNCSPSSCALWSSPELVSCAKHARATLPRRDQDRFGCVGWDHHRPGCRSMVSGYPPTGDRNTFWLGSDYHPRHHRPATALPLSGDTHRRCFHREGTNCRRGSTASFAHLGVPGLAALVHRSARAFGNWLASASNAVATIAGFSYRIAVEGRPADPSPLRRSVIRDYMRRSKRLIPGTAT